MVEKAPPTFVKVHIQLVVLDSTVPGLELLLRLSLPLLLNRGRGKHNAGHGGENVKGRMGWG